MNDRLMKMMEKKKNMKELSPMERDAKLSVVKDLRDMAANGMADKLKNLKKVTVASNDEEGLAEGLDKAKELIGKSPMNHADSEEESASEDMDESPADEEKEDMAMMSPEELDAKIKELLDMKAKMEVKKA